MVTDTETPPTRPPKSRFNWIAIGMIAILAYFLIMEHWAHILPWLPYVLVLCCVVMYLFIHGGHGGDHKGGHEDRSGKG